MGSISTKTTLRETLFDFAASNQLLRTVIDPILISSQGTFLRLLMENISITYCEFIYGLLIFIFTKNLTSKRADSSHSTARRESDGMGLIVTKGCEKSTKNTRGKYINQRKGKAFRGSRYCSSHRLAQNRGELR